MNAPESPAPIRLSMRSIEVLPELLQTRAGLNMDWAKKYAEDMAKGELFDPVLVYLLPDRRYVLADGFHRHWAARKIGKREILAFVRDGSLTDALLAGIAANMDKYHRGLAVTAADRIAAVEKLIRNEDTRIFSDTRIAELCGSSCITVRKRRLALAEIEGIPLPDKVTLVRNGKELLSSYRKAKSSRGQIQVTAHAGGYRASVNGERKWLGVDHGEAMRAAAVASDAINDRISRSKDYPSLKDYLLSRCVNLDSARTAAGLVGAVSGNLILCMSGSGLHEVYQAIGRALLAHASAGNPVIVAWLGCSDSPLAKSAIDFASSKIEWLQFMTPEDIADRFAHPKAPQAEASACQ